MDEDEYDFIILPCIIGPKRVGWIFEVYRNGERVNMLSPKAYATEQMAEKEATDAITALTTMLEQRP